MGGSSRYRAIWLADARLGTPHCQAAALLRFLQETESEYLYLVGDMASAEASKACRGWDARSNDIVAEVLRKARAGTRVVYLPGDEDHGARELLHCCFGGIAVQPHAIHVTANDLHLLVLHGDQLDEAARRARWLSWLGAKTWARRLSHWCRQAFPGQHLAGFEEAVTTEAQAWDVDGVVCGHARRAALRTTATGLVYANPGDWVDHCTALVEHVDGHLELLAGQRSEMWPVFTNGNAANAAAPARHPRVPWQSPFSASKAGRTA